MQYVVEAHTEGDIAHALRTLSAPEPPVWLRARVMAAIAEVDHRRRVRRTRWRRVFALALLIQFVAYAASERMGQ